jgi:hypothetical protein
MSRPAARKAPPPARTSARALWLRRATVLTLPTAFFLTAGFRLFVSTGRDDAHITYWPAYALARFGEIVNYNGERVEQSSSLLHVLLLAFLRKLTGLEVATLGKLSSILAGVGTLLLTYMLIRKMADRATAFASTMLVAACAYFLYWSYGGLETTLVCCAGIWLILSAGSYLIGEGKASLLRATFPMLVFALARPESPLALIGLLVVTVLLSWTMRSGPATVDVRALRYRAIKLLGVAAATCALLFAFRLLYFGSAFPQPVTAKHVALSSRTLLDGWQYLKTSVFGEGLGIAVVLCTAGAACLVLLVLSMFSRRPAIHTKLALVYVVGYLLFAVVSGGDWMEGGRFLVFFLPVALGLIPVAVAWVIPRARVRQLVVALYATALVVLEANSTVGFAKSESMGTMHWRDLMVAQQHDVSHYSWFEKRNRVNMRDIPVIEFLNEFITQIEALRPGVVVLMTGQMGMIPYHVSQHYFGRVRFIDRRGLCDRSLTDCDYARRLPRGTRGVGLDYIDYFKIQDKLGKACNLPRPDLIFDLGGGNTQIVGENGYAIVARQFGEISDIMGEGGEVKATGFVAMRRDLWTLLSQTISADSTTTRP